MEREYNNVLHVFEQELSRLKKVSELLANASHIADSSAQASQTVTESFKNLITIVERFIEEEKSELSRLKYATNEVISLLADSFKDNINELNELVDNNIKTLIDTDKAELINISDRQIKQFETISDDSKKSHQQFEIVLKEKIQDISCKFENKLDHVYETTSGDIKKSQQQLEIVLKEKIQDISCEFENKLKLTQETFIDVIKKSRADILQKNEELNETLTNTIVKYQEENKKRYNNLNVMGILMISLIIGLAFYIIL